MLRISICVLFVLCANMGIRAQQSIDGFLHNTDAFLRAHVHDGQVDYTEVGNAQAQLDALKNDLRQMDLNGLSIPKRQSVLINAYNLIVISKIASDGALRSVRKIPGFFDANDIEIGGRTVSLNTLEAEALALNADGRVHFALVCGARGCPTLANRAYHPDDLDLQLTLAARNALRDPDILRYDEAEHTLYLSDLFKWYADDFANGDVIKFINTNRTTPVPANAQVRYTGFDWALNEHVTPHLSASGKRNHLRYLASKLYQKGEFEIHIFNNYYSQKDRIDPVADDFDSRTNFFTILGQFLYGLSPRVNVGLDIRLRSVTQDLRMLSPTFDALKFKNEGIIRDDDGIAGHSRTGITAIGPRIKYQPFRRLPNVSFQHTLYIPVGSDLEGSDSQGWIDWSSPSLFNQIFYDENLSNHFSIFVEFGFLIENFGSAVFRQGEGFYQISTPMNVILNYYIDEASTLYVLANASPRWAVRVDEDLNVDKRADPFSQYGAGYKVFLSRQLQLEFLYTFFHSSAANRSANTFNLGFRYMLKR